MTEQRITRKVRAGGYPPTELPPLVAKATISHRRYFRFVLPYLVAVVVLMVACGSAVFIALGGKV